MSDAANNRNGRTAAIIALAISILIAIGGWAFAGVQAGRMQSVMRMQLQTDRVEAHSSKNEKDIAVINTKLDMIIETVKKIEEKVQ